MVLWVVVWWLRGGLPAWGHGVFAVLSVLPWLLVLPRLWRGRRQPVLLVLDATRGQVELPPLGRRLDLREAKAGFYHDYFRDAGPGWNRSEFNLEVAPLDGGPAELIPLLHFRGYCEEFDKLGERLRLLGFSFGIRKHES